MIYAAIYTLKLKNLFDCLLVKLQDKYYMKKAFYFLLRLMKPNYGTDFHGLVLRLILTFSYKNPEFSNIFNLIYRVIQLLFFFSRLQTFSPIAI